MSNLFLMHRHEQFLQIFLMVNEQSIVQTHCLFAYSFGGQSATLQLRQYVQEILHIQCHKIGQRQAK
jgi:hypothetical protein